MKLISSLSKIKRISEELLASSLFVGGTASPGSWAGPSAGSPAPQEPESANRLSMDAVNTGV